MSEIILELFSPVIYVIEEFFDSILAPKWDKYLPALTANISPIFLFYVGISTFILILTLFWAKSGGLQSKNQNEKSNSSKYFTFVIAILKLTIRFIIL
jgi:hypothetical protein